MPVSLRAAGRPAVPGFRGFPHRISEGAAQFGCVLALLALSGQAIGAAQSRTIVLTWDANTEADVVGYKLRYGTASGVYDQILDVGSSTTATVANLAGDVSHFFVVSAYNSAGIEGPLSDEAVVRPNIAELASLSLSDCYLQPGFAGGTLAYTTRVPYATASLFVIPTLVDDAATVTMNGVSGASGGASAPVALNVGSNSITVVVTAQNGYTTKTYIVEVTRLSSLETWRLENFDTLSNTGIAADSATPQNDGITNLMKFATAMNPNLPGANPGTLATDDGLLFFTYTRNKAAMAGGVKFAVEWSDILTVASWSRTGVGESVIDQGTTERVTAYLPAGSGGQRFMRLVVSAP